MQFLEEGLLLMLGTRVGAVDLGDMIVVMVVWSA
jgi:hypothetical protein